MHNVIQVLSAILIGTALGAVFGPRNNFLIISSLVTIALGVVTIITPSWLPLAIGTVIFLVAQSTLRDRKPAKA